MGVSLRLLPFDCDAGEEMSYSHTLLEFGRFDEFFEQIKALPSMPVPDNFTSFSGHDEEIGTLYGETIETPYGERVRFVLAGDLVKLALPTSAGWKQRAIWAYLRELPERNKIALYWH